MFKDSVSSEHKNKSVLNKHTVPNRKSIETSCLCQKHNMVPISMGRLKYLDDLEKSYQEIIDKAVLLNAERK